MLRRQRQALGLTSKSSGWRGTQHNPGTPITQKLSKVALNKGFDENGQLPQGINEDENENEEHRDTSHARFCFPVQLYNKRGINCITMDVSDPSPRLHSPRGYNRDTKETSSSASCHSIDATCYRV